MACLGENTLLDLVDAMLAPAQRAEVEAHAAGCATCRRVISKLVQRSLVPGATAPASEAPPRRLAAGTRVGRYVVRAQVGAGAMGAVFAAYDPELDRTIALKRLHAGSTAQHARISQEARTLARLSHPNVVAAFDVSELDGDLILAMELVAGPDLATWAATVRSTADILAIYRQAGSGLAAAHAAGLVHRDFKPANALIGGDGRVRVVDFGLAAGVDGSTELVGTPAYMAPEVFEAGIAAPASDQFSFCVALYEALHGQRPFATNLIEDVARGPGEPSARAIPRAIRAALARGLHVDPARRFPSMTALIDGLTPRPRAARAAIAASALVAIGALLVAWRGAVAQPSCAVSDAARWPPARALTIHARFLASGLPFADPTWRTVDRGLTDFHHRLAGARTEACEATRVRGVQSDHVLALREACLARAGAEADALEATLATADRETITHAAGAVEALGSLAACANVTALVAPVPPPTERDAARVSAIAGQLAQGNALRDAARWGPALTVAASAVEAARDVGHEPTRAAALFLLGQVHEGEGAGKEAEAALRDAYAAAERGHDDLLAARVATELVFVVGEQLDRIADALEWAFHADLLLHRAGGDRDVEARLDSNLGNIRYNQADYARSRALYQKALDLRIEATGEHSRASARALFNLGRVVMLAGDHASALAMTNRALTLLEAELGPDHPDVIVALSGLATIEENTGAHADALATFDRALASATATLGERHPEVGRLQLGRATCLHALGREHEAATASERGLRVFEDDAGHRLIAAEGLATLGDIQLALGAHAESRASFRRALAMREAAMGHASEEVASSLEDLARLDATERHAEAALAGFREALAIRTQVEGPDYFNNAGALRGIGEALCALGRAREAVAPLRRAVELLARFAGDPVDLAAARLALAGAIWDAGGDHAEARALAADALAADPRLRARVLAWQRAH